MLITLPKRGRARERETKLAQRRLKVLELAKQLGNVTEACRRSGMDRARFYDWKRRYEARGLDGLKDLPPVHKTHPMTTPAEVVERIRELALLHPACGCDRLAAILVLEDKRVSSVTVQDILNRQGLGTRGQRWLALEHKIASERTELSTEQIGFLEKLNLCFKELHAESERPGKLLSCHTFKVPSLKRSRRIYLHVVVDTYGSYAFGLLSECRDIGMTVAVLQQVALPFYTDLELAVTAIDTNNSRRLSVSEDYKFRRFLALNPQIQYRQTKDRTPNGFALRFQQTVLSEFFRPRMRDHLYQSTPALQADLDGWLYHYNHERPHLGYRNQGRTPADVVQDFVGQGG